MPCTNSMKCLGDFIDTCESHMLSAGIEYTNTMYRLLGNVGAEYVWVCGYMNFLSHALVPTPTFLPPTPHYRTCWHHACSWYSKGPQPARNSEDNEVSRHRQNGHHQIDRQDVPSPMRISYVDIYAGSREEEKEACAV